MRSKMKSKTESPDIEYPAAEIIVGQEVRDGAVRDVTVRVRLTGRRIHLLRCWNGDVTKDGVAQGGIVMPEVVADRSWWYRILAVSPDCRYFTPEHIGGKVKLTDNGAHGTSVMVGPAERVVREDWLASRTDNPFCVVMEA